MESARAVTEWLAGSPRVAGCRAMKPPQAFGPDELWEAIDGAAETYLAFEFRELSLTACVADGGVEVAIEVYRMADALNGFGIYAQERPADADVKAIGAEGYASRNVLNLWNGPFYVKLRATTDDAGVVALVAELARRIGERLGPPPAVPARLNALPPDGQVAHTIKYVPRDVLGQRDLSNAVEAQYRDGAKTCRLVIASLDSAEQGADALARFKAFVGTAGRVTRSLSSPGDGGFVAASPLYGSVVAARAGPDILVVLGASSEKTALELITAALGRRTRG